MRISDWSSDVCSSDLVFTDVVMPGMTGLELASKLKQQSPRLPIILTTGYSDRLVSAGSEGSPVLPKPYSVETLAETLTHVLAAPKKSGGEAFLQRTPHTRTEARDRSSVYTGKSVA